ncbi:MAG TPA: sigma-70 family RNA polymerase sigma factor [Ktedonobacterales bacterium]|jgi:RNA polymerase sigma-70 factor (ECF subfamily)
MQPSISGVSLDNPATTLYEEYAPILFAYLRRQTASLEDAEDLLVEVFLAACERDQLLAVAQGERRRWLFGVAQHKLMDYYRRSARRPVVPLDSLAEALEEDAARAPEEVVLRQEARTELRAALLRLPPQHQEVLQLRFAHGLGAAEIAAVLGKSEGTVRMVIWRALKLLRAYYHEDERGDGRHGN